MILKRRDFEREAPTEDAKKVFIFCEGKKREKDYFNFFKEIDSRINIEVYELDGEEDNSPLGLFRIAFKSIFGEPENNIQPLYDARTSDEVWIVIDIDADKFNSRVPQILEIENKLTDMDNWTLVKSNPCFEVWLYYHLFSEKAKLENENACKSWKGFVNSNIPGGFDPRKHPIYLSTAILNSEFNFNADELEVGTTEVYLLGQSINDVVKDKIENLLKGN